MAHKTRRLRSSYASHRATRGGSSSILGSCSVGGVKVGWRGSQHGSRVRVTGSRAVSGVAQELSKRGAAGPGAEQQLARQLDRRAQRQQLNNSPLLAHLHIVLDKLDRLQRGNRLLLLVVGPNVVAAAGRRGRGREGGRIVSVSDGADVAALPAWPTCSLAAGHGPAHLRPRLVVRPRGDSGWLLDGWRDTMAAMAAAAAGAGRRAQGRRKEVSQVCSPSQCRASDVCAAAAAAGACGRLSPCCAASRAASAAAALAASRCRYAS